MIDCFDIRIEKKASSIELTAAIASAYNLQMNQVNLQYHDAFDYSAPKKPLLCIVMVEGNQPFQTMLTLDEFDCDSDIDIPTIASKISYSLGCDALIHSDIPYDDEAMLYISGHKAPKLVLVYEERDEAGDCIHFKIDDYY